MPLQVNEAHEEREREKEEREGEKEEREREKVVERQGLQRLEQERDAEHVQHAEVGRVWCCEWCEKGTSRVGRRCVAHMTELCCAQESRHAVCRSVLVLRACNSHAIMCVVVCSVCFCKRDLAFEGT